MSHRAIRPEHVVLTDEMEPKLISFGLSACRLDGDPEPRTQGTQYDTTPEELLLKTALADQQEQEEHQEVEEIRLMCAQHQDKVGIGLL